MDIYTILQHRHGKMINHTHLLGEIFFKCGMSWIEAVGEPDKQCNEIPDKVQS